MTEIVPALICCKTIPFAIASKIIKYLGIKLTKNMKDLYTENYKSLVKYIEKRQKNMEKYPVLMD